MTRIDLSPKNGTALAVSATESPQGSRARFALRALPVCLLLAFGIPAHALPQGGVVAAGSASIAGGAASTTITQSSQNAVINWQSFGIAAGQSVQFIQPGASAVALNRVLGADPSSIMGNLSSNGKVFLLNPNGILFGSGASVNVGALVASTLSISDANFMAGQYTLSNPGDGAILNQGTINAADGGYVALLGRNVSNQGVISARLGTVVLAAGNAMTLDVAGDGLLNVSVAQGSVNALVENGGMISAAGGSVLLTAQGAGNLLQTVVNNTGLIQAQTIASRNGRIMLLGDMQTGTMNVGGTLDASAPNGGNGGFIETSAAHVNVLDGARITTAAPAGLTGNWLIDPQDFIIGPGGNISGATLSAQLVTNNITIVTAPGPGNGDIFVNDAVSWTASGAPTTLTLNAARDVNINAPVTAVDGNFGVCCGRDVNVNATINMTRGSLLLSAGRNLNQNAAITVTDGNLSMCAANDVTINSAITLTRGNPNPTRSLGLPLGLTIRADTDGTGPGALGGTVVFSPLAPTVTVTGPNAPASIFYNPVSYSAPTDYGSKFTLTGGATLTQRMLVFPEVSKPYDGSNTAVLTGLKGNPNGVTLIADPGSTATFDTIDPGTGKTVTFTGYRLAGPNADQYALASTCCGPIAGKTTGSITPNSQSVLAALTGATGATGATAANPANATNPANPTNFSYLGLVPLAGFAFYSQDFLPAVYAASEGELYMPGEQVAVAEPAAMPQRIYVAPRYLPRQPRN